MIIAKETYIHDHGLYAARVLADSISSAGVRIVTLEATFPRPYLAEVNTHRVFSRNSASSRAIPTEKLIERVRSNPYIPETFNRRVKGMGVGVGLDALEQDEARQAWLRAAYVACDTAEELVALDVDKSRANRLLEPFMWHTAIITSTEWSNFFALRCPRGEDVDIEFPAQPEFQQIAILMRRAIRGSEPQQLEDDQWHLPMATMQELKDLCEFRNDPYKAPEQVQQECRTLALICSRRLARVSFDKHTDTEPADVSITKAGELAQSGHFSPMEHIARPISARDLGDDKVMELIHAPLSAMWYGKVETKDCWSGNLHGWLQFRKLFAYEDDHSKLLDYDPC